jgi:hypothetical protein
MGLREMLQDELQQRGIDPSVADSPFVRSLLGSEQETAVQIAEIKHLFACIHVGYDDCDDEDAKIALMILAGLESFMLGFLDKCSEKAEITNATMSIAEEFSKVNKSVVRMLQDLSAVRAIAMGRELPKLEDFLPPSRTPDPDIKPPVFVPPTGNAA